MARKLFCELSPLCYRISLRKEFLLRDLKHGLPGRDLPGGSVRKSRCPAS